MSCERHAAIQAPAASPQADRPPVGLLWTRLAKEKKPGLSRDAIVDAAITLADAEGLGAVSIRRVAAALGARPMSLYSHIKRKDDLFELMTDKAIADIIVPEPLPANWREALWTIAQQTRAVTLRRPWIVKARGTWPRLGPNAIRHMEQSLAAVASLDIDQRRKICILRTIDTYTIGHIVTEHLEQRMPPRDSGNAAEQQHLMQSYLRALVATGDYPRIADLGPDLALLTDRGEAQQRFDEGLEWVLAGIAASLAELPRGARRPDTSHPDASRPGASCPDAAGAGRGNGVKQGHTANS
ncbi:MULTISPECIES: TetR/AcrR family transcriptional regulator [Protofrankia]|uniref:Regulatory protein TetR n=1 Tax=Candidatus Protofrankia datiscae TaxID=2716812 RepID=F8AXT6_9ACTN|nr:MULTISPECIES: TetR/AcrR family transcriptional regulator [Protofrankia]AEH11504.1 regulatory protein TetR [Candidatus Protofrankia datiscae]